MFKIMVNGKGFHCFNKNSSDFLKAMPAYYSDLLGEKITKDDLIIYKYSQEDEEKMLGDFPSTDRELDDSDKIKFKIKDMAKFQVGEVVSLEEYESQKANRIELFQNSVDPQKDQKVQFINPVVFNEDNEDKVQIAANDFLAQEVETLELELVGELVQW